MPLFVHPHPYIQVRLHQVLPTLNPVAVYHPNQNHMNQRNLHHMIVHPAILCVIFSITTPIVHKIPPIKKGTKERIHSLSLIPLCTIIYPIKRTLVVMRRNCIPLSCHNRFSIYSLSTSITPKRVKKQPLLS